MVYHRSLVITVSVKIESSLANIVRNPAIWQPMPEIKRKIKVVIRKLIKTLQMTNY